MEAFIFDMDGVMVDSELHWESVEGFFLRTLVPTWTEADQARIVGLSVDDNYRLLVSDYGLKLTKEQFLDFYMPVAREIYGRKASLIPGCTDLMAELQRRRVTVALASSSPRPWIDIMLDRFGLRGHFAAVVSADELERGEGKPSPAIYLLTAQRLGVRPGGCVVMEDSRNGVLSARNAGMYCIGFRNGFNDDQDISAANVIVRSYAEIDLDAIDRALSARP
jgi:HAD superfamily hydrolase (TIGR01509 family)